MTDKPSVKAGSQQTGKTKLSLFTVLGGVVLLAFGILVGANLWSQYRLSNQIIDQEINNSADQHHALFKAVLNGQLNVIENELQMSVQQKELSGLSATDSLQKINLQLTSLVRNQNQMSTTDFLIISNPNGSQCLNSQQPYFSAALDCGALIRQFDSDLHAWHLAKLSDRPQPTLALMTRAPLILRDGLVLGYLYGGVILSDNFSLLNRVIKASPEQVVAEGIAYQNQLIAFSASAGSIEHQALQRAAEQPETLFKFKQDEMVAISQKISFGHERDHEKNHEIRLVSVIHTDVLHRLQQGLIQQTSAIMVLAILLAILIVFLTLRLTLTPLGRLGTLASERNGDDQLPFNPGPIIEFQQLSHGIAEILTELRTSESNLIEKSRLLELSHNEQLALIGRNRKLLHQLFNLQEQERKHLAQELHDELGQPLAVINTDSYLIKKSNLADANIHQCAESIHQNAKDMSDVVYNLITSLRPMPLNDLGLFEAIRHMPALDQLKAQGIQITTDLPETQPELADSVSIHIFRIVQEGLSNILKHSQASQAWLQLQMDPIAQQPQLLVLKIIDNGTGFEQQQFDELAGYGLNGMIERVNSMGGALTLGRDEERRFCIHISITLSRAQRSDGVLRVPLAPDGLTADAALNDETFLEPTPEGYPHQPNRRKTDP